MFSQDSVVDGFELKSQSLLLMLQLMVIQQKVIFLVECWMCTNHLDKEPTKGKLFLISKY